MEGSSIGYNVANIKNLMGMLVDTYESMGEKMTEGWSNLSTTLETEWIGPDEVSYEKEVVINICDLYLSCTEVVKGVLTNIQQLGETWKQFQMKNVLTGSQPMELGEGVFNTTIEIPNLRIYDIGSVVKAGNPTFTEETTLGLVNGVSSAQTITTVYNEYVEGVYNNVKSIYSIVEDYVPYAFKGGLEAKLKTYLEQLTEALAKVTTCHKDLQARLTDLINAYQTQDTSMAEAVKTDGSFVDYAGQNLK